ncbi:restriction endonuclease, SacI family [Nocardiopsis sp. RSe5-2]|uniref:Restriction endonuclease, SacI family n=1 Tax=Nocardiopsis endophytica TaxID=3018445 RepID=A0ABT4TXH7_9ACTN|nr:restriction endonuclease, SacI family [Nocardiopsis endophytica]MDA2809398.1 restriction endonuclease, SacI family [Nocardiopsis endophytica]
MGVRIDKAKAQLVLEDAYRASGGNSALPVEWEELARYLREQDSPKTYTAALTTALLARACNEEVDPLSIKEKYSSRSFSLRTLCHTVVVPYSVELGFDIGATGREPINNQPFFRYDHYDQIERIQGRARPYFERLRRALLDVDLDEYSEERAFESLAAVIKICREYNKSERLDILPEASSEVQIIRLAQEFVTTGPEVPKKLQACVAAALDIVCENVISRRLNDPSRDVPGDVQAVSGKKPFLAVEVRGKAVSKSELEQFVRSARQSGIPRACLVVDSPFHESLPPVYVSELEAKYDCLVEVEESVSSFLRSTFFYPDCLPLVLKQFPVRMLRRMEEIEVQAPVIDSWISELKLGK